MVVMEEPRLCRKSRFYCFILPITELYFSALLAFESDKAARIVKSHHFGVVDLLGRLLSISRLPMHTVRSNGNINGCICSATGGAISSISVSPASRSASDCSGQLYRCANRHQSPSPRPSIQYDRNSYSRPKLSNA